MLHENYTKKFSVNLTQKEYDIIKKHCDKYGLTMSKLVRRLLQQIILKELKEVNKNEND